MQLMQLLPGKCSATEASRARWYVAESAAPPPMLGAAPIISTVDWQSTFTPLMPASARVHQPIVWIMCLGTRCGSLNGRKDIAWEP